VCVCVCVQVCFCVCVNTCVYWAPFHYFAALKPNTEIIQETAKCIAYLWELLESFFFFHGTSHNLLSATKRRVPSGETERGPIQGRHYFKRYLFV